MQKKTLRLQVDPLAIDSPASQAALAQAADILRSGGTVAFPTETVYGLGACALDANAVAAIFQAKQRPSWDPLIVHVTSEEQLQQVAQSIPANGRVLMQAFWPGPLTLLLPKAATLPLIVTAGRPRVGVRMPSHPVARALIQHSALPIAAPSANSFGRTSPTRADFVLEDLDGRIDAIIDSGETALGLESTVVDVCDDPPMLYRPGMVSLAELQLLCPSLIAFREPASPVLDRKESLPSPGIGMKHYAPKARLILVEKSTAAAASLINQAASLQAAGEKVGLMLPAGEESGAAYLVYHWGHWTDQEQLARRLFAGLRELDAAGATVILCPVPTGEGLAAAIRDRLQKAAR